MPRWTNYQLRAPDLQSRGHLGAVWASVSTHLRLLASITTSYSDWRAVNSKKVLQESPIVHLIIKAADGKNAVTWLLTHDNLLRHSITDLDLLTCTKLYCLVTEANVWTTAQNRYMTAEWVTSHTCNLFIVSPTDTLCRRFSCFILSVHSNFNIK